MRSFDKFKNPYPAFNSFPLHIVSHPTRDDLPVYGVHVERLYQNCDVIYCSDFEVARILAKQEFNLYQDGLCLDIEATHTALKNTYDHSVWIGFHTDWDEAHNRPSDLTDYVLAIDYDGRFVER